jgi:hypothetical protein
MARVIELPRTLTCPHCGLPLRPAMRDERRADLLDARYRHVAQQAAQGARHFEPPAGRYPALVAEPDAIERPRG